MAEERFALADSLDRAVQLFAVIARQKGVDLSYHVPDEACLTAVGDAGRLGQVLSNLIGNAVKFTDSGWVWVETEMLRVTPGEAYLRFSVHDTGMGIDAETRARLFQPFYQADATSARKYGGTGLGLAISRQLVKMMGGEIGVESEPGRGSKFWFTVRLTDPKPDAEARRAPTGIENLRVALIGESGAVCAADRYLEIWGIAVHRFADCSAAAGFFHNRLPSMDARERWIAIVDVTREAVIATRAYLQDLDLFNVRLACISPSGMPYKLETPMRFAPLWLPAPIRRSRVLETIERIANPGRASAAAAEEALESQSANLLLVEDNPVNQKVALGLLRRLGYEADAVSSGIEALEAARAGSYSAILMDCQMPGMDGFEATAAIRRLEGPMSRAPIIALTANAMPGDRERCLRAGMDDYIPKPVQIDKLSEVLERWTRVAA
jgi:CheY-like chemotaxis protein